MAMTKAEMEAHHADYDVCLSLARQAEKDKDFLKAVDWAVSSWDHIDGMLRFERKYRGVSACRIAGLLFVLRYAPLLMDFERLNGVESILKRSKRITRSSSDDLRDELSKSQELLQSAHRLWGFLERHAGARQDELRERLGGNQDLWRGIAENWESMLLLRRQPESNSYRLAFVTQLGSAIRAKCAACGVTAKAPKEKFLSEQTCPKCRTRGFFVMLPDELSSES